MRKVTWMLISFILVVCISLFWSWWKEIWFRPIEVVSVAGQLQFADPRLVKNAVTLEVQRGFFGMQVAKMRDRLMEVPWIVGASVQRKWPNAVVLVVQERQPLARFADSGIIDTKGKLFYPPVLEHARQLVQDLPEFVGSIDRLPDMLETYLQILAKIKPLGLAVKRLIIMPDNGWQAMLDNNVTIVLGQNELEERLTRFVLAYSEQKSGLHKASVQVVDLRYTNGLAVSG